jgi:hypothetical protein
MASFKHRPDKLKYLSNVNTLDELHRKQVITFETKQQQLPRKRAILQTHEKELEDLEQSTKLKENGNENLNISDIKHKAFIKEKIQELKKEINDIEGGHAELEYYSRTHDILMDYYTQDEEEDADDRDMNILVHETSIETSGATVTINNDTRKDILVSDKLIMLNQLSQKNRKLKKPTRRRMRKDEPSGKKRSVLSFFTESPVTTNASTDTTNSTTNMSESETQTSPTNTTKSDSHLEQTISNKATLFDEYMNVLGKSYNRLVKPKVIKLCDNCHIEKTLMQSEGMYVCRKCGECENIIIESEVPNHKDALNEKPRYPYKRVNHLTEWLNQLKLVTEIVYMIKKYMLVE